MSVFGSFKEKLQSVTSDFSSGFQRLKQKKSPSFHSKLSSFPSTSTTSGLSTLTSSLSLPAISIDASAGAELLNHYQEAWHDSHAITEQNVLAADQCGRLLTQLHHRVRERNTAMLTLHRETFLLPQFAEDLSNLVAETAKLQGLCEEVDTALNYFEVICNTQEHQEQKLDARFNLALYRERKVQQLSEAKSNMGMEYISRMEAKEKEKVAEKLEKQNLYQEAFEQDLELYKATGLIANTLPPLEPRSPLIDRSILELAAASQIRGAHGELGKLLRGNLTGYKDGISDSDDGICEMQPVLEDLGALEEFLSDVKLEDSGIAGSDSQSVSEELQEPTTED